jgi:hypothetical protein
MSDYERDETRATLERLFWRARVARDVLNAASADPDERAKAACHWALLYRVVHSRRRETAEGRTRRLDFFESLAAMAGIAPLLFYLREFALGIGHTILASPNPVSKLDHILNGPPKTKSGPRKGTKKRSFRERIEIAEMVQTYRNADISLEKACEIIAKITNPRIGSDAVRRIYENETKEKGGAALVRFIARGEMEF